MIVSRIRHPVLTIEERAKRLEEIKQAATRLVLETEKSKKNKREVRKA